MVTIGYIFYRCCIHIIQIFVLNVLDYLQMHADDFRLDRYGVVSGLRDGGYSDDMTLAAIAGSELFSF